MRNEWIAARKLQVVEVHPINRNWTMQVLSDVSTNEGAHTFGMQGLFAGFRMIERKSAEADTTKHVHVEYIAEDKMLLWDTEVPASVRSAANDFMKSHNIPRRRSVCVEQLLEMLNEAYESLNNLELYHSECKRGKNLAYKRMNERNRAEMLKTQIDKYGKYIAAEDPCYYETYVDKYDNVMEYIKS